jgi:hypothetical protein
MSSLMTHSLQMQIAEIEREITMRRKVYPTLIGKRAMRQAEADMRIGILESVLATLLEIKRREAAP